MSVYSSGVTPPQLSDNTFSSSYVSATLYVPYGAVVDYKSADGWKNFWRIEGFEPTGICGVRVTDDEPDNIWYDLNGRRLPAPQRGLNIVNGKKVIMK